MRFVKKNRNPLLWGRKSQSEDPDAKVFNPVASEERSALLSGSSSLDMSELAPDSGSPDVASEMPTFGAPEATQVSTPESGAMPQAIDFPPTPPVDLPQRLMTALGRFQREVARAQDGADPSLWADECMNYLILALDIALSLRWTDVVRALGETGRLLRSYQDAGQASGAVPFLADCHGLLALMVTELQINGVMRPLVQQKWHDRHGVALADMEAAGITLTRDDEDDQEIGGEVSAPAVSEVEYTDEASPDTDQRRGKDLSVSGTELPPLEPLKSVLPPFVERAFTTPGVRPEPEFSEVAELPQGIQDKTPSDLGAASDSAKPWDTPEEITQMYGAEVTVEPEPAEPSAVEEASAKPEPAVHIGMLDLLSAALERISELPPAEWSLDGGADPFAAIHQTVEKLMTRAAEGRGPEERYGGAETVCHSMERLCAVAATQARPLEDRFFDICYAFSGVYADAIAAPDDPLVHTASETWIAQAESLMTDWAAHVPKPSTSLDDGSPGALLETAQRAMAQGNMADAKMLAMEAAAQISREQTDEAQARVQQMEARLKAQVDAIAHGREQVAHAEAKVAAAEKEVADSEGELRDRQSRIARMQEELEKINAQAAEFEARLKELKAQHDAVIQRVAEMAASIDETQDLKAQAESNVNKAKSVEEDARIGLEDMRQEVKNAVRKRSEIESAMERAREAFARKLATLEDIEQTVGELRKAETESTDDGELLF